MRTLITSASRGNGAATARRLARTGRRMIVPYLRHADEVADAIAFLISERASYLTGTTVHVNGGLRVG